MAEEILLNVALNKDLLPKSQKDVTVIARLDIEAAEAYRQQHQSVPADICLLLDSSGSMDEPFAPADSQSKRAGVIQAAKQMLPHLGPDDTVSIIFYDSQAHLIATRLPSQQKQQIEQLLDTLNKYNGATNFEAGLRMVQAIMAQSTKASRRLFFLTDGNPTMGNQGNVGQLIEQLAKEGVIVDCLGVGGDFNFAYMRQLSAPSNGTTELLDNRSKAGRIFEQILVSAQRNIANNVFLHFLFAKDLRDLEVYQTAPETRYFSALKPGSSGRFSLEINVQSLRQDRRNIYLFKASLDAPTDASQYPLAEVRLDYDLPPAQLKAQRATLKIGVNFTDQKMPPMVDSSVDDMFAEAELAKFYEQFMAVQKQDWSKAVAVLDEMIRRANVLDDQARLNYYRTLRSTLQKDHRLSDDDLNRVGASSTKSALAQDAAELGAAGGNLLDEEY